MKFKLKYLKKPTPVKMESAPFKLNGVWVEFMLFDLNTGNAIGGDSCNLRDIIIDFIEWDEEDLAICPYSHITGQPIFEIQAREIENFIRLKKRYGYYVTHTEVFNYFGISDSADTISAPPSSAP